MWGGLVRKSYPHTPCGNDGYVNLDAGNIPLPVAKN